MFPQLPDRFELVRSLGEGGMGVVYEALDRVRGEHVALKTLRRPDADAVYRLKREFRALANLEHPNLVRLYDLFADGQTCFFTMELVQGVDLAEFVRSARIDASAETVRDEDVLPFDEGLLRHAFAELARGVGVLHDAGLLHRDLKPSNVLVTRQGRVVVLDFGLVADAHAAVQQTKAGGVTGTVAYMAPEQARGESELTTAVEIYAIGAILFELLTRRLPYLGHPLLVLTEKQTKDAPRPSSLSGGVPSDLDELCVALLGRDPSSRPSLSDVRRVFDGGTAPSTRSSSSSRGSGPVLLGRDEELARLETLYRRSHAGRPAVGLVRGRSGIGKSALLSAFARRSERDGHAVVLAGRCHESETVPYKGLDGVIDALSRHLAMAAPEELGRLLPPDLGDLATVFPVRSLLPIGDAPPRHGTTRARWHDERAGETPSVEPEAPRIAS